MLTKGRIELSERSLLFQSSEAVYQTIISVITEAGLKPYEYDVVYDTQSRQLMRCSVAYREPLKMEQLFDLQYELQEGEYLIFAEAYEGGGKFYFIAKDEVATIPLEQFIDLYLKEECKRCIGNQ